LRQRGNRILLVFQDGHKEEMLFLGPDHPGPSPVCSCGFIWDGHGMGYRDEPFTEYLHALAPGGG
jgi:hypothetical protein